MSNRVLILTNPDDVHSFAVAAAIRRKGGDAVVWHTSDFPTRTSETIAFEGTSLDIDMEALRPDARFDSIWLRRPTHSLEPAPLHPDDLEFADEQCRMFRLAAIDLMCQSA